jgi:catechol 2,3-dioxygenase-like lactoylglutathione lyase family enzyme
MARMGQSSQLLTRREFVQSLAASAFAAPVALAAPLAALAPPPVGAQAQTRPIIKPKTLNHVGFFVSDVRRTAAWYQDLFGMPVQFRTDPGGAVAVLRIGAGPEFIALFPANGANPGFRHMGFGVEGFSREAADRALAAHDVRGEWRTRAASGGDVEELVIRDPDNLMIQVQDVRCSGGGGRLGDVWSQPWTTAPQRERPRIQVRAVNHVTFGSSSKEGAEKFYRDLFGLPLLSWDYRPGEPSKILGVAVDAPRQFIAPGQGRAIGVSHYCLGVDGFDREAVARVLTAHGMSVPPIGRERPGCCGSAIVYNPAETVYGRDPDGFSVQFTDSNFCAGTGPLGTTCIV